MKGKKFTEERIVAILKESNAGAATKDLCRRHGICEGTFYRWKAKYADMEISEVHRLKAAYSGPSRPLIPLGSRPPIPVDPGHPFRWKSAA